MCTLLASLPAPSKTWYGGDSEAWLERYGLRAYASDIESSISETLRIGLALDAENIRAALTMHLRSRLDGIEENISWIIDHHPLAQDSERVLKVIQYWNADRDRYPWVFTEPSFLGFVPQYTRASIAHWRQRVSALENSADKLESFNRFADIEQEFEPLERLLSEVVALIDQATQLLIDQMRGK